MARVVTADGVVAICVPAGLDDQPAYGPLDHAVGELAGPEAQALMTTYWSCGDLAYLRKLFASGRADRDVGSDARRDGEVPIGR